MTIQEQTKEGDLITLEMSRFVIDYGDGTKFTALDLVNEAEGLQRREDKLSLDKKDFSQHFFQIAGLCDNHVEFYALCEALEHRKHWGRVPADTPEKERTKWGPAPDIWKVYKSTIGKAWQEYNIKPGGKYKLIHQAGPDSSQMDIKVEGINQLKKFASSEKMRKERLGDSYKPHVNGVIVTKAGDLKPAQPHQEQTPVQEPAHSPRETIPEKQINAKLAAKLGAIVNAFDDCSEDMQTAVIKRLDRILRDMKKEGIKDKVAEKVA